MVDDPAKKMKKKKKKGEFSEEDVCDLLQRYNAMQVLALLREVAQSEDVKIDWNDMVRKTETGITSAREFQMLWRHIAYRHPLAGEIEHGDQPLDDDSDIEYELEPFPPVSTEFSMEVANCVKVLAFGSANKSSMPNSSVVESDMPNDHSSKPPSVNRDPASLLHSSNITPTVPVQKQPQASGPSGNGFDNNYPRRKRNPWSEDEDLVLIAGVEKFGESNWANIVKEEFKGERTPSQLYQRWQIIKKRKLGSNIGGASSTKVSLADTRRALDMAFKDNIAGGSGTAGNRAAATNNNPILNAPNRVTPTPCNTVKPGGAMGIKALPRPPVVKKAGPVKPPSVSDSIQAAAVAAGARIASPSDAANILKATQSKNAVHIIGGGTSLRKSTSLTGNSPLPPNVHFIRTGLAATSMATRTPPLPPKGSVPKWSVPATTSLSHLPKAKNAPSSSSSIANEPKGAEQKTSTQVKSLLSDVKSMVEIREGNASLSSKCLPKAPERMSKDTVPSKPTVVGDNAQCATSKDTTDNGGKLTSAGNEKESRVDGSSVANGGGVVKVEASNETVKSEPMDI